MKNNDIYKMYSCLSYHDIDIRLIEKSEMDKLDNISITDLPKFIDRYKIEDVNLKYTQKYIFKNKSI